MVFSEREKNIKKNIFRGRHGAVAAPLLHLPIPRPHSLFFTFPAPPTISSTFPTPSASSVPEPPSANLLPTLSIRPAPIPSLIYSLTCPQLSPACLSLTLLSSLCSLYLFYPYPSNHSPFHLPSPDFFPLSPYLSGFFLDLPLPVLSLRNTYFLTAFLKPLLLSGL